MKNSLWSPRNVGGDRYRRATLKRIPVIDDQYTEIASLAGGLAHEIKNPLSTIRLNMELLAEDLQEIELPQARRSLKKVELVQRECGRLENLLNDFLQLTRPQKLNLVPSDVNQEIRDLLELHRPKIEEAKIELRPYLANDLPTVMLDRQSFHRALLNLVLNAQQSMPGGGQLVIRTRTSGVEVLIELIDTGCGMESKVVEQLFTPFFSTKRGGSGLGLPMTRRIIEAHGGCLAIQSELNFGTQLTLTLPSLPRLTEPGT